MNNYKINSHTLALLSINNKTKVIEENNSYIINQKTKKIIEENCKSYGSSYLGRHEGSKYLTGFNYKTPIIIEESKNIIFFPTRSIRKENCNWISSNNIKKYDKYNNESKITFKNDLELVLDISIGILKNQILKSVFLENQLKKIKNNL